MATMQRGKSSSDASRSDGAPGDSVYGTAAPGSLDDGGSGGGGGDDDDWGDDSDDDTFAERQQKRHQEDERRRALKGPAAASGSSASLAKRPATSRDSSDSLGVAGPSSKPSSRQISGSGRGFWDIPAANGRSPMGAPAGLPNVQTLPAGPVAGALGGQTFAGPGGRLPNTQGGLGSKAVHLQRQKTPTPSSECKMYIRPDVDGLMEDPMHALERLKISMEEDDAARATPPASAVTSLPWEAVLPPELVSPPSANHVVLPSEPPSPTASRTSALTDPSTSAPSSAPSSAPAVDKNAEILSDKNRRRLRQFFECLSCPSVDISQLRKLAWQGIPQPVRAVSWQLLLGYLPAPAERRKPVLKRKRQEYADAVRAAFARGDAGLDAAIWHQICIDIPRTNPAIPLWQFEATQRSLERILYVWAIRHPASGYVQGINDLVTPFFQTFLTAYVDSDPETFDVSTLPDETLQAIEADSFWSLSKLLDGIQDNYTFAQPGIQRQVARMKELCKRVDAPLYRHLEEHNVEFIQFAFRWMNCLLMRELSTKNIIRMWDTYLAEGAAAFSEFHLYVCIAFLVRWSEQLRSMDFQEIIIFLQALPTQDWNEKNTELLLSEAFMWSSLFHNASGHFERK